MIPAGTVTRKTAEDDTGQQRTEYGHALCQLSAVCVCTAYGDRSGPVGLLYRMDRHAVLRRAAAVESMPLREDLTVCLMAFILAIPVKGAASRLFRKIGFDQDVRYSNLHTSGPELLRTLVCCL